MAADCDAPIGSAISPGRASGVTLPRASWTSSSRSATGIRTTAARSGWPGYQLVDAEGRFLARDALPGGLIVCQRRRRGAPAGGAGVRARRARPPLSLRPEPVEPARPERGRGRLASGEPVGYVPRDFAPRVDAVWSALVLRERRDSPRDPRTGLTMLLARDGGAGAQRALARAFSSAARVDRLGQDLRGAARSRSASSAWPRR